MDDLDGLLLAGVGGDPTALAASVIDPLSQSGDHLRRLALEQPLPVADVVTFDPLSERFVEQGPQVGDLLAGRVDALYTSTTRLLLVSSFLCRDRNLYLVYYFLVFRNGDSQHAVGQLGGGLGGVGLVWPVVVQMIGLFVSPLSFGGDP